MNRRTFLKTVPAVAVLAGTGSTFAQDLIGEQIRQKDDVSQTVELIEEMSTR